MRRDRARSGRLLAAYDRQLRGPAVFAATPGAVVTADGPVLRATGLHDGGMVMARGPHELPAAGLELVVDRQIHFFADLGTGFEWKTFAHDLPRGLPGLLLDRGLRAGEPEAVMVAQVADLVAPPSTPTGVTVRELTSEDDFHRLASHLGSIWGEDMTAEAMAHYRAVTANPGRAAVVVAELEGEIVSSARAEVVAGTDFCGLWGGSTAPGWRGRGLYRLLVARRADLAARRGCRLLQVDALPTSRPILERLGFTSVTTTVPYRWSPGRA